MDNIKVLLCCGAGMSSGFLARNARKVAKKKNLLISIEARSHSEVAEFLQFIDLLMIGPHYAAELEKYQKLAMPYNVPVVLIPQDVYAQLDGERLIELVVANVNK